LKRYENIRKILALTCKKWNVKAIVAHNARFDYLSTTTTQRYLTCSKYRFFFPYGIEIWDTLKMARECFNDEEYDTFCYNNDYVTKNGRKRYTAEILYRFLTNDDNFVEKHTGLEDVMIEKEIFAYCMRKNPEICGKLW
jgi:DNA polymerase III epsilon subunit-like protein